MPEELVSVGEVVDLSPSQALDRAEEYLCGQGHAVVRRTATTLTVERRSSGDAGRGVAPRLTVLTLPQPGGGVKIKVTGDDREGVSERQGMWALWTEGLPKRDPGPRVRVQVVPAGGRRRDVSLLRPAVIALAALAAVGLVAFLVLALPFGERTSEDVVEDFREAGLPVGRSFPVEEESDWEESPVPKVHETGTRFEIPTLGKGSGGRVFTFETQEDLEVMRNYYEGMEKMPFFGSVFASHLYQAGNLLLQINGELPKEEADRYGAVL